MQGIGYFNRHQVRCYRLCSLVTPEPTEGSRSLRVLFLNQPLHRQAGVHNNEAAYNSALDSRASRMNSAESPGSSLP